jgi:hypothetical protein
MVTWIEPAKWFLLTFPDAPTKEVKARGPGEAARLYARHVLRKRISGTVGRPEPPRRPQDETQWLAQSYGVAGSKQRIWVYARVIQR